MPILLFRKDGVKILMSKQSPVVGVSSLDTTPNYLLEKLAAGSGVEFIILNEGTNEIIQIAADGGGGGGTTVKASDTDTTPDVLTEKLVGINGVIIQLLNAAGNEQLEFSIDADGAGYSAALNTDWNGSTDPGDIKDALDQLAARAKTLEGRADAQYITFTPSDNTKWTGSVDPGDLDDTLNQLGSRVKAVELSSTLPDASAITYTPADNSDWGGSDPGDVDNALDYLANQFGLIDASTILFSVATPANWTGSVDPGEVDDSLNQLASRVKAIESAGGAFTAKVSSADTTADFLESTLVAGSRIAITKLNTGANETLSFAVTGLQSGDVGYTAGDTSDWSGSLDPGDLDDAVNQLAQRLKDVEGATSFPDASAVAYTPLANGDWDGSADPGDVDNALDQLASRVKAVVTTATANDFKVKASSTDATPSNLEDKLVAGDSIAFTVIGTTNKQIQIDLDLTSVSSTLVTYGPADTDDWNGGVDPGNVDDALDQLALRVTTIEDAPGGSDASAITFTPVDNANWNGGVDPGNVDDALDELVDRVQQIEDDLASPAAVNAADVVYTPNALGNWNSSTDPGDANDAFDQLAARTKTLETNQTASSIAYTPSDNTDWNSSTDPGQTDDALDQLADRVKTLEGTGAGNASTVVYTPADTDDWTGAVDPGEVDDALDQLALRMVAVETGGGGGGSTAGFLLQDIALSGPETVTTGYQAIYVGSVIITDEITVDGELWVLDPHNPYDSALIDYNPVDLTDWTSDADPGTTEDALDQLAARVTTIEAVVGTGILYQAWDAFAPPVTPSVYDDEFKDGSFNTTLWDDYGSLTSKTEDTRGLTLQANTAADTFNGIYQVNPGGDFTIETYIQMYTIESVNGMKAGLALFGDAANTAEPLVFFGFQSAVAGFVVVQEYSNRTTYSSVQPYYKSENQTGLFFRVRVTSSTAIFATSSDGDSWYELGTPYTLPYAIGHFGLVFLNDASVTDLRMRSKFFRYHNSDVGRYAPIYGRAMNY